MRGRLLIFLQNFFSVNPKEARGLFVLILLSVFGLLFPVFLKHYLLKRSPDEIQTERQFLDSLVRAISLQKERSPTIRTIKSSPADAEIVLKKFNPNLASEPELTELGIPAFLAKRIVNYRGKGGVFKKKEDLKKIYDFPEHLYLKLEPYVELKRENEQVAAHASDRDSDKEHRSFLEQSASAGRREERVDERPEAVETRYIPHVLAPFDINKADTVQLTKLKGIAQARAKIIINYRDALGGFHSESQYSEIYSMDSMALAQLRSFARVLSAPRKLRVNEMSLELLMKHPYARKNKKYAEAVIRYREQNGPLQSRADLDKIVSVPPEFLDRMAPYFEF